MKELMLALVAMAVAPSPANAEADDYRCVIKRVNEADESNLSRVDHERKMYVGREFTVDRRSGVMAGALKNSYVTEPVVVDRGSKENSFKAVTTMRIDQGVGAGSSLYALVINEYVDSTTKPFVFLSTDTIYFGNCIHF